MPITSSLAATCGYGRMNTVRTSGSVRVVLLSAASTASWTTDISTKITSALTSLYPAVSVTLTTITDRATNGSTVTRANYDVAFVVTDASFTNSAL